ncbi:uncharacterized protein A4U43_C07F9250 [Asparagus officinalis]|uniref:Uncharacterized protein n=1 Tax=Asparagus officinalis TaxID=4686 RepID=A0A5P1EAH8_ASPOF|nr:uncharacterized protein A4U43_C07F9250 [Asparagus officinalis]
MGTEILHPEDCLTRHLRKPHLHPNPNPNHHAKAFKKRRSRSRSRSPRSAKIMGQVTILKPGESLFSSRIDSLISDPKVYGSGRLGPDPDQIGVVAYAGSAFSTSPSPGSLPLPSFSRRKEERFSTSPSPGSLPLPSFSRRKEERSSVVDQSATKDLRRLLRLD